MNFLSNCKNRNN